MKILILAEGGGEETSRRMFQTIRPLKKRHELIFLRPKIHHIKNRSFWPLRAFERLQVIRRLIRDGKKMGGVDLIYCMDVAQALPGFWIAKYLKKPFVWQSERSMKAFWDQSHKYATQVLPWVFLEKWLVKKVDYLIAITETDRRAYIQQGMDPNRIHVFPFGIPLQPRSQRTKEEAREFLQLPQDKIFFLFFSMFDYLPNKTALEFLNKKVAPLLPGKLLLCGKGNLSQKLHPNIKYLGFLPLPELYDLIKACDVCLSPIWEISGTMTKVLEMLGHGAPTVITTVIQEGIPEIQDGVHALIAKDGEDFIQKTLSLARNKPLQEKLKKPAMDLVQQKYDARLYEGKLLALIESFRETSHGTI